MMMLQNIQTGIASVRKARFRSAITMLGIIVGIVSVVTIVSLGEGIKRQINGQVTELGQNLITVRPGKLINRTDDGKISSVNILASTGIASITTKDVDSIRQVEGVESAAALGTLSGVPSYNDKAFKDGFIIVTSQDFIKTIDHKVEFGTFLNAEMNTKKNAIIGPNVASQMFNETIPLGKSFSIKGQEFIVQGVFEPFSEAPISNTVNFNNAVFIPEPIATTLNGSPVPIYEVLIKPKPDADQTRIIASVNEKLTVNHSGQEDFSVLRADEVGVVSSELMDILTRMIVGMAGITLFVGGIGIMNVMLVSVSERTREIGIRKSIGATNSQIRSQFMIEATILSVWGAFFGLIIAGLLHLGIRLFTELEPTLTWQPVVVATVVAVGTGIVFGVIPALKASRKDPIDSLRLY